MSDVKYVTQEAFDTFAKAVSNKLSYLETIARNTIVRQETLLKLLCAKEGPLTFDVFVDGLKKYDPFVAALQELRAIPKMGDRIDAALKYNAENPDAFTVMADDISILEQTMEVESISKVNFDKALQLPHTIMFEEALSKYLPSVE